MTLSDIKISESEIKRYIFAEMSEREREHFEESFFISDELFYEILDLENELVDRYANKNLKGEDLARFEKSLEKLPDRKLKTLNARALQSFISDERTPEQTENLSSTRNFRQKLADFFTIKTPALGYAMSGLIIFLAIAAVILLVNNRHKNAEVARLENEKQQNGQFQQRQAELQNQIETMRRGESELQNRIDAERETSGDLTDELENERQTRQKLEAELEKLKNKVERNILTKSSKATKESKVIR